MEYLKLIGILIVILGFVLRFNPLIVVLVAGIVTGLVAGINPMDILGYIGTAFVNNRSMALFILILPVIGLLERYGLRERAEAIVRSMKAATPGRIMMIYMLFRQITQGLGLNIGGHPQFIRPIVGPMAEAAATQGRPVSQALLDRIRAMSASSENYGNFYGQLMFVASAGLLLIQGTMKAAGYDVDLVKMALYAIPTAIAAAIVAFIRFTLFDRQIEQAIEAETKSSTKKETSQ
jgi:uncharacterized membrane protein